MSDPQQQANDLIARANELHNNGDKLEAAPMYVEAAHLFEPSGSLALVAGDTFAEASHKRLNKAASCARSEAVDPVSKRGGLFSRRK